LSVAADADAGSGRAGAAEDLEAELDKAMLKELAEGNF
jgi:hypothetical protein